MLAVSLDGLYNPLGTGKTAQMQVLLQNPKLF